MSNEKQRTGSNSGAKQKCRHFGTAFKLTVSHQIAANTQQRACKNCHKRRQSVGQGDSKRKANTNSVLPGKKSYFALLVKNFKTAESSLTPPTPLKHNKTNYKTDGRSSPLPNRFAILFACTFNGGRNQEKNGKK